MTQTEAKTDELVVGQLVRIKNDLGWYRVTELPETRHDSSYVLYGGLVGRNGVYAKNRFVKRERLETIDTPGRLRKAAQTLHAIDEALSAAPKVSSIRKPGRK
jgi:hypothetical protein